jgi:4-aminobutyrate aminotransferase-like enzyme/Ser/Thr protein kinase RdoA (MazF antagonist)
MNQTPDFISRNRPDASMDDIHGWAKEFYGLTGRFTRLHGERDLNFRLESDDGQIFLFKVASNSDSDAIIALQIKALEHIKQQNPDLPVPEVVAAQDGQAIVRVKTSDDRAYRVRLMTYLSGTRVEGQEIDSECRRSIGALMAELDQALVGFFHPAALQDHPWTMMGCARLLPFAEKITDTRVKAQSILILEDMRDRVIPKLMKLRHQVIHQDAHGGNLLLAIDAPHQASAILDFGDMTWAPLVTEIALAADVEDNDDAPFLSGACDVIAGYDALVPLQAQEIDLVYDLMLARYAMTLAIGAEWQANSSEENYLMDFEAAMREKMSVLLNLGSHKTSNLFRQACNFPPTRLEDDPETEQHNLLSQRREVLGSHLYLFYDKPLHIERAGGPWLHDTSGKSYLDAYNNVPTVGHCHPHVVRSIARQTESLNTNTRYLYRRIGDYSDRLVSTLDNGLSSCLYVNSGSEANDIAWRTAKYLTGKTGVLIMTDAYHGITDAIARLSPSGEKHMENTDHVRHLLVPGLDQGQTPLAHFLANVDEQIASLEAEGKGVAAFMIDSAMLSSGVPDVPAGYLQAVADKVRAAGGLIIADEVQAGFARSGIDLWGHRANAYVPDIVTLGKPVANGYPMGVMITRPELLKAFGEATGIFSTFGGNPVACAAASAVLDVIEREKLLDNCFETGNYMRQQLRELQTKHSLITDVRGTGLAIGVELKSDGKPAKKQAKAILNQMRDRGVLIGKDGPDGNVLKIRPPLVFNMLHADQLVDALDQTLRNI